MTATKDSSRRLLQTKEFTDAAETCRRRCEESFPGNVEQPGKAVLQSVGTNLKRPLPKYLPPLPLEYYCGDAVVLWTLTTFDRARGWLDKALHTLFREINGSHNGTGRLDLPNLL